MSIFAAIAGHVLLIPSSKMGIDPTPAMLWISIVGQLAAIGVNVGAAVAPIGRRP